MSDYNALIDRVAAHQIDERVRTRAAQMPSRRPRGRHALAHRLHALADRLDG
jgi:surfactin synthase thioesterase subunit